MHGSALGARSADAGLADLADAAWLVEREFKSSQLLVGLGRGTDLLTHQVRPLTPKALELDHEATDVSQLQLTQAAQVPRTAAHLGGSGASAGATVSGKRVYGAHRRVPRV